MKIIGYINPNGYFPSPMITFAESCGRCYALYPGGSPFEIADLHEPMRHSGFISETGNREIAPGQYAYALQASAILIEEPKAMYQELQRIKETLKGTVAAERILDEYLKANREDSP